MDHGLAVGVNSGNYSNVKLHDNHIHDMTAWDTASAQCCPYHHDGIHVWGQTGGTITGVQIYNNLFNGDSGVTTTAWIYIESNVSNSVVFNNVLNVKAGRTMNTGAISWAGQTCSSCDSDAEYDNVDIDDNSGVGGATCYGVQGGFTNFTFENNIAIGCNTDVAIYDNVTTRIVDYNIYDTASVGTGNTWGWNGSNTGTLSKWQNMCSCDSHSVAGPAAQINVNINGQPQAGSITIGAALNLTSLDITPLDSDKSGNPRPESGTWTTGAYQISAGSLPNAPRDLSAVVN
jgi:hypothetical protein